MSNFFRKAFVTIKRDYLIESSYKLYFALDILYSLFPVFTFYFVGKLVGKNYFTFAVIGIALTQYFNSALKSLSSSIRDAQMAGSLEALMSTRTDMMTIMLTAPLYTYLIKLVNFGVILAFSAIFLHVDYSHVNIFSAFVVMLLSIAVFSGLGILAGAFILIFKRGNPLEPVFVLMVTMLSGAYFPVNVLPKTLRWLADINPVRYAVDAARNAIISGHSIFMLQKELLILIASSLVLIPVGLFIFTRAIRKVKRDGSLMVY